MEARRHTTKPNLFELPVLAVSVILIHFLHDVFAVDEFVFIPQPFVVIGKILHLDVNLLRGYCKVKQQGKYITNQQTQRKLDFSEKE